MAEQSLPKQMRKFVCFHLGDKHAFGPFTGQDFSAWSAFVYAVELYGRGDARGQAYGLDTMKAALLAAQQKSDVLMCFQKAIPGVLDWSFETRLWTKIAPIDTTGSPIFYAAPGERVCSHMRSKPAKDRPGWYVCRDPLCKSVWRLDDDGGSAVCPL